MMQFWGGPTLGSGTEEDGLAKETEEKQLLKDWEIEEDVNMKVTIVVTAHFDRSSPWGAATEAGLESVRESVWVRDGEWC